jgi:hypothetical protein
LILLVGCESTIIIAVITIEDIFAWRSYLAYLNAFFLNTSGAVFRCFVKSYLGAAGYLLEGIY